MSVCFAFVTVSLMACEQATAPPLVVPSGPSVYVTTNNTVNVYPAPTASAPVIPAADNQDRNSPWADRSTVLGWR